MRTAWAASDAKPPAPPISSASAVLPDGLQFGVLGLGFRVLGYRVYIWGLGPGLRTSKESPRYNGESHGHTWNLYWKL